MRWIVPALLFLASMPGPSSAATYRCDTEWDGVVFSDRPCLNGRQTSLETPGLPAVGWTASSADYQLSHSTRPAARTSTKRRSPSKKTANSCWKKKQRLERVNRARRKGYSVARGERLREQRRDLQAYLRRFCR